MFSSKRVVNKITQSENLSVNVQEYFTSLNQQLKEIYEIAIKAREKGLDPSLKVEIPIAEDIADRVEGLIGPEGVGERIRYFENNSLSREQVAFKIVEEICEGKLISGSKEFLADQAIRSSLAVITESITAAPLEGIAKVKIKKNDDGSEYLAIYFAGPIRSAGGTAAGMSVLLADYIREKLGLAKYQPDQREVERYVEELELYNRVSHLQIPTTKEEQRFTAQNLTIEITGEPTDKVEVSGNRDLRRVETNRLRGGACLVFNDGLVGRSKKLYKRVIENNLQGWDWFEELISIHERTGTGQEDVGDRYDSDEEAEELSEAEIALIDEEVIVDAGYIKDVIGGRPVFAHPSEKGGFRLRYGRSRTTGLASMGIHPALMGLVDDFLACGTHLRTERPGKGAIVMPVDTIHPPIVRLQNGNVVKVDSYEEAKLVRKDVDEVLFLGDMLYGVGEFNQNNYELIPSGYCEEWWIQELEEALMDLTAEKRMNFIKTFDKLLNQLEKDPLTKIPSSKEAIKISKELGIPLHPEYTYHWSNLSFDEFSKLRVFVSKEKIIQNDILELPLQDEVKAALDWIYIPHNIVNGKINFGIHSLPFLSTLGISEGEFVSTKNKNDRILEVMNSVSEIKIRAKCQVYTGARMGRPEKAKDRRMRPPVHMIFPIEDKGGRLRDLLTASKERNIEIEITNRRCPKCGESTHRVKCSSCESPTTIIKTCPFCKIEVSDDICSRCGKGTKSSKRVPYPLDSRIRGIRKIIGAPFPQKVKAVKKLMNKDKVPELLEKGILRSKHDVFVYRDGTIRFDATDAVLTHFKPSEIRCSVQKLHEIGYTSDIHGKPLEKNNQIIELKIQDIILNIDGGKHLVKISQFVDELLEKVYKLPRYYNATKPTDLIGQVIIGLAPHTSAGIVGRLIGFTNAKVNLAHPYWHAAKRRNADGDEDSVLLALDAFLNFSKSYLPEIRGGKMDAPLILVANLNPHEVDDESQNVDTCLRYPLSFYEATLEHSSPKSVLPLIDMIRNRLNDESAYEGFKYSHGNTKIFDGPETTTYKSLTKMEEKVRAQLRVAELIRSVDVKDVASRIVINHFIPDLIGNLRRFGSQKIRCTKCNRIYRRIPISGTCLNCGKENLNLTVYERSVSKYFAMATNLVNEYQLSGYLKSRLEIIKHNMESLFEFSEISDSKSTKGKKSNDQVVLADFLVKYDSEEK